jgi:hypothetical protein
MGLEKTYSGVHTQSSSVEHWTRAAKKGSFPSISIAPLKIHEPTKPYYTFNY